MNKLLKSILIATASIGAVAGSVASVVSCGENSDGNKDVPKGIAITEQQTNQVAWNDLMSCVPSAPFEFKYNPIGTDPAVFSKSFTAYFNMVITSKGYDSIFNLSTLKVQIGETTFNSTTVSATTPLTSGDITISINSKNSDIPTFTQNVKISYLVKLIGSQDPDQYNYENEVILFGSFYNLLSNSQKGIYTLLNTTPTQDEFNLIRSNVFHNLEKADAAGMSFIFDDEGQITSNNYQTAFNTTQADFSLKTSTNVNIAIPSRKKDTPLITTTSISTAFKYVVVTSLHDGYIQALTNVINHFSTTDPLDFIQGNTPPTGRYINFQIAQYIKGNDLLSQFLRYKDIDPDIEFNSDAGAPIDLSQIITKDHAVTETGWKVEITPLERGKLPESTNFNFKYTVSEKDDFFGKMINKEIMDELSSHTIHFNPLTDDANAAKLKIAAALNNNINSIITKQETFDPTNIKYWDYKNILYRALCQKLNVAPADLKVGVLSFDDFDMSSLMPGSVNTLTLKNLTFTPNDGTPIKLLDSISISISVGI